MRFADDAPWLTGRTWQGSASGWPHGDESVQDAAGTWASGGVRCRLPDGATQTYHEHCSEDRSTWMAGHNKEKHNPLYREYGADVRVAFAVQKSTCV